MKRTGTQIFASALVLLLAAAGALALNGITDNSSPFLPIPPKYEIPEQLVEVTPQATTLFFGGDIMLARDVGSRIATAKNPNLPFTGIKDAVESADISFANLESPFSDLPTIKVNEFVFRADPNHVTGLQDAGFDIISTANNHALDQGLHGLEYTLSWLQEHGIDAVGTGSDCHAGVIKEVNGIKIGFLAYSYGVQGSGNTPAGVVCFWNDTGRVAADIQSMKLKADLVIVSAHMGLEYRREPSPSDVTRSRAALDAGADLLIGHHPHWIQTVEEYNGKFILYSLGNLVFDQMWSQDTREGLTASVLLEGKNISRIQLMPVVIENYCCPRWASAEETKTILNKINLTDLVLFDKN